MITYSYKNTNIIIMKRILITGGTGFIGSYLCRYLLNKGHKIYLLVRPGYKEWRIKDLMNHINICSCDLNKFDDISDLVKKIHPEWIFHLAAYGAYPSQNDLNKMIQTNLMGLINLLNACIKVDFEVFINAGSSSEYGFKDHAPNELELPEPNSDYAYTKASATAYCSFMAQKEKVNIQTLRLYSIYGPYEEPSRLIQKLIVNGLKGKYPPLVNPEIARDFLFVKDVCKVFELCALSCLKEKGGIYNLGTGCQTTIGSVVNIVRELLKIEEEPDWGTMPSRIWDTNIWVADPSKVMKELNWHPEYTLKQGLAETINWFQDNPALKIFYEKTSKVCPG